MSGSDVRALRVKYARWDVDALLGMTHAELVETHAAARIIYDIPGRVGEQPVRDEMIRKVLGMRDRFVRMGPSERAQIVVEDGEAA